MLNTGTVTSVQGNLIRLPYVLPFPAFKINLTLLLHTSKPPGL